ncbi:putative PfkB family carbohydrate kinase [Rhodopseudomonas palustris BisB5]|uniref:Putative PfkB family carbohydrate kinase n=1 Tax=Rhodopseudomonas palustris (strain BisB5) TaxID=316057 RepID=Q13AQ2_RHOPS|nr:putative PfkB family carbohydrate kinase [Rhodopseudomonas palustris BisB5]
MTATAPLPLLMGEVFVDFTITPAGEENKLRLGGIAHAARGFWALSQPFRTAAIIPSYLERATRSYFASLGCVDFLVLGIVSGAPNVTVIFDATELADQGYDTLLRDEKTIDLRDLSESLEDVREALIFPGTFNLIDACQMLPETTHLHVDVAYDVHSPETMAALNRPIETILISTSSPLFARTPDQTATGIAAAFAACKPKQVILKQNRGGTELLYSQDSTDHAEKLPAQLGKTINSVGVGDVFAAAFVANLPHGAATAGWRATYAAAAYSQTTYPDIFKKYVARDQRLSLEEMRSLWGTFLPWNARPSAQIYFAAPDFANVDREAIEEALKALNYHNFSPRRPVVENGELPHNSDATAIRTTYEKDYELLKTCSLVFAVPTGRDPGTLVEIGLAIEARIPVVTYDPRNENNNTMVIAGSSLYSNTLDACLNAVFELLGQRRENK